MSDKINHVLNDKVKQQIRQVVAQKEAAIQSFDQRIMDIIQTAANLNDVDIAGLNVTLNENYDLILSQ